MILKKINFNQKLWLNRTVWGLIGIVVLFLSYQKLINNEYQQFNFEGRGRVINVKSSEFGRIYTFKTDLGNLEGKSKEYLSLGENIMILGEVTTYKFNQDTNNTFKNYLLSSGTVGEFKNIKIQEKLTCDVICKVYKLKDQTSRYISQKMMNNACLNVFKPENLGVNCGDIAVFARGLLIGDVSAMTKESKDNIKTFGLTHLIAVSGFQVACLAAAMDWILRKLVLGPKTRVIIISSILLSFLFLVGLQPPILRATLSFLFIQSFLLLGRQMSGTRALFLAGITMLILNPFLIISYSFWLSVLATLGVIFSSKVIDLFKIKSVVLQVTIVCVFAYLFTLGIILQLNETTNLFSIFLNILISPIIPILSVFLLISTIPVIGQYIFIPAGYILTFLLGSLQDFKNTNTGVFINIGQKFDFYDTVFYYTIFFSILFIVYNKITILTKEKNQSLLIDKPRWWNW